MADFSDPHIKSFVELWFGNATAKRDILLKKIRANPNLHDLARHPLLLTLLCATVGLKGTLPQKSSEVYEQALNMLLKCWDKSKNIRRGAQPGTERYHHLTLDCKHQLFAHIAHTTFEKGETLIPKEDLVGDIAQHLSTLSNSPAAEDIEGEDILEAIEAQHGILVQQALDVYAFAHLTFYEYYTAYYIVKYGEPEAIPDLLAHAHESRWREVILLTTSLIDNADDFFAHFLVALDTLVCDDTILINFLAWATRKATMVSAPHRPAAVRAFYSYMTLTLVRSPALDWDDLSHNTVAISALAYTRALACALALDPDLDLAIPLALDRALNRILDRALDHDLAPNRAFDRAFDRALDNHLDHNPNLLDLGKFEFEFEVEVVIRTDGTVGLDFDDIDRACARVRDLAQELGLETLCADLDALQFPSVDAHDIAWGTYAEQLQAIMILHRDIGHDWDFTDEQVEKMSHYFAAAYLLEQCLDVAVVTDRAAIEDRLLLPPKRDTDATAERG